MRRRAVLVSIVLGCAVGCGGGNDNGQGSATPTGAEAVVVGIYDATVVRANVRSAAIGSVGRASDGSIFISVALGNDASASLSGQVADDGRLSDDEAGVSVTDIGFRATGRATFADEDGVRTVSGTVTAPGASDGFDGPIAFTLRRPADADASGFSGTYRFEFTPSPSGCGCASELELTFAVEPSGSGTAGPSIERTVDGTAITRLNGASIAVSPEGRMTVRAGYFPERSQPVFSGALELLGRAQRSDGVVAADGETFIGFTPDFRVGTWSAERVP